MERAKPDMPLAPFVGTIIESENKINLDSASTAESRLIRVARGLLFWSE
jgi:hypothetical protein